MKRKVLKRSICILMVCCQMFVGGLIVYVYDSESGGEAILPSSIGVSLPRG